MGCRSRGKTLLACFAVWCGLSLLGCGTTSGDPESIAYVSLREDSAYTRTFEDLPLGVLYDFHLKLTKADESWVRIWLEAYRNGKPADPFRLAELSYGMHPNGKVVEGPMGVGLLNPRREDAMVFVYSSAGAVPPHAAQLPMSPEELGGSTWGYAIGDEGIGIQDGETKLLGVYRQTGAYLQT
ncbi:hypothetical protein MO973_13545 [Paenibacillus sp. TRM 82003]|nr:hypothetical protein [Paenibacillus sp. TRM 82003]